MSGGAFNYLHARDFDARIHDVTEMVTELRQLGHTEAADRSQEVLDALKLAARLKEELVEVWRVAELVASGDSTSAHLQQVVQDWKASRKTRRADQEADS